VKFWERMLNNLTIQKVNPAFGLFSFFVTLLLFVGLIATSIMSSRTITSLNPAEISDKLLHYCAYFVFALSLYLLYPTYKLTQMSEEKKESMEREDRNSLIDLRSKSVNLGLDLQGGMHVILEVDIKELLNQLAKNKNEVFVEALEKTAAEVLDTDEDFITVFNRNLQAGGSRLVRYYGSRELSTEDDVLDYLREQTAETANRAQEILANRVDEFGVAEPIIQKQGQNRIIIELAGITDPSRVRQLIGKTAKLEFRLLKDREITLAVAEKMQEFVQAEISPVDTTADEDAEKAATKADREKQYCEVCKPKSS